jgi:hypothetical protein
MPLNGSTLPKGILRQLFLMLELAKKIVVSVEKYIEFHEYIN